MTDSALKTIRFFGIIGFIIWICPGGCTVWFFNAFSAPAERMTLFQYLLVLAGLGVSTYLSSRELRKRERQDE